MENKKTLSRTTNNTILLNNEEYFKYIFKKTEKIACTVFYIMRHEDAQGQNKDLIKDLKKSAQTLLRTSLLSLRAASIGTSEKVIELRFNVIELESQLRVAHAGNVISVDTLNVFLNETDSVSRSIKKYAQNEQFNPFGGVSSVRRTGSTTSTSSTRQISTIRNFAPYEPSSAPALPRRSRILDILKDRGEASIKDIGEVITDCSEKTIQRDLIRLIKDNLVMREGERRWSKYKAV